MRDNTYGASLQVNSFNPAIKTTEYDFDELADVDEMQINKPVPIAR
ncbi:MAG: hypothetical protein Q8M99_03065 [Methylotenera sp.]|nr:hypothetical protein [Methylotenera sp.]